jgi:glycosyltransferase involved in cell wall biosynthesis
MSVGKPPGGDGMPMISPRRAAAKLCIATPEFPPEQWGGLARTVGRTAEHAAAMGLEVHVAHLNVEQSPFVLLDENRQTSNVDGVMVHRITVGRETGVDGGRDLWECPHTLTLRMMYQSLEMLHQEHRFDLFHAFFLYPVGFVTGLLARRMRRPTVLTIVGNDIKKYVFSPEKVAVCKSGLETADRVVALSEDLLETADSLTRIRDRARIVYNSVDAPERAWRPRERGKDAFRVGCAGIFKYAKGLPYLMKAVARLAASRDMVLEIRGTLRDSEKDIFAKMVETTGTADIIRFREPLPHERITEWLQSLDAFVLPSVSEGCPNILMEALAAGLPCTATRTGAADVLIEDRVSGILVPWGDSAAIADALAEVMDDPGAAEAMGAAARERMKLFSASREREEWERVYRELVDF